MPLPPPKTIDETADDAFCDACLTVTACWKSPRGGEERGAIHKKRDSLVLSWGLDWEVVGGGLDGAAGEAGGSQSRAIREGGRDTWPKTLTEDMGNFQTGGK